MLETTTDDMAEEFMSPPRKSSRKKIQTTHYGHSSPAFASPQSSIPKESQESDTSEFATPAAPAPTAPESDESSDDSLPLSQYSPEKGKKRGAKASKKLPTAKKARTTKGKSRRSFENIPEKGSMFDIIRGGRVALQTVVDDWIENYNNDRASSMVDLIQVIIQCCGCKGIVSEDMLEEEENVNAIRKLTEEFDEDTHEYPLTMSGAEYKKFKNNFCEFIALLIEQCQHSIVYDDYMIDKLMSWLISLSDSQVRAFRHTSTLAGMKLVGALIQIALKVNVELDNTQRQLDSEKRKSASKRGVQKMEMLQNKKGQLRDYIRELEEFMNYIFQGIFVHRYRDIRPEIRSLCISEIGTWMKEYSAYFLSHKYLKYVVWTLHDKDGDVRFHALQSLHRLYEVEEFLSQLEPLTSRFKGRIVAMTLDLEPLVTVEAIKLVTLLFRYGELDEEDCQQIEQLVFSNHRQVSHEAGAFLNDRLLAEAENSSPTKKKASKKSEFERKAEYIKKLIDFYITSQDWELMTTMLLDDNASEGLSDEEETALIQVMTCCCRQAATGQGPTGRFMKRLLSTKEKKTIVNDKQEMSGHFMVQLPVLLGKYGTDLPKAEELVSIAQYFDLEEYAERRLEKDFEDLLNQVDDLVQKGPETSLLEECSKTYRVLTDNELTLKSKAEVARNKLIDSIVELFKDAYHHYNPEDREAQEDDGNSDVYAMEVNLRRITAFYKCHDLGAWDLYDILYEISRNMNASDEVCKNALISLELSLIWSLHAMKDGPPKKRETGSLKQRLHSYIDLCGNIVESELGEIRKQAFLCLCDTIVVFAKQLNNNYPSFSSLVYTPSDVIQSSCSAFATNFAFSDLNAEEEREDEDENTENEVEELNEKRVVLAGLCKLFAFGIFEMVQATQLFSHFISAFGNFGDLIKQTMAKCRESNLTLYTKTLVQTLYEEYDRLRDIGEGMVDKTSRDYIALKELARRFALTYGIELTKDSTRNAMISLHREAITHSFSKTKDPNESIDPDVILPNIAFLDVITECSSRLIPTDKKAVLRIVQKEMEHIKLDIDKGGRDLQPLISYRRVLLEGSQAANGKTSKGRPLPQKAKRKLSVDDSRGSASSRKSGAKRKSGKKEELRTEEEEDEEVEVEPRVEASPVSSEHIEETRNPEEKNTKRKRPTAVEASPVSSEHGKETRNPEEKNVKRKRPTSVEASPVSSEHGEETRNIEEKNTKRKRPTAVEASPVSSEHGEETRNPEEKNTKRKRSAVLSESNSDEEENSEDEFQESNSVKASSQASWLASQPKPRRSANHSKISYGKTKETSRVSAASPIEEEEEEHIESEEPTSPMESPKSKTPPRKRTKRDLPEDIFEESPALESQTKYKWIT